MATRKLEHRCKEFAVRVISLVGALPDHPARIAVGTQLIRSATTIGAQYRAARHANSRQEFRSKIHMAENSADESVYWLRLLADSSLLDTSSAASLLSEARALFSAIGREHQPVSVRAAQRTV